MAVFAITFRIFEDESADDRRESLIEAIEDEDVKKRSWDETTSFHLIESRGTPHELLTRILQVAEFDDKRDKLVAINLSAKNYAYAGNIEDDAVLGAYMMSR